MKTLCLILGLLQAGVNCAQFSDNFSDGNFNTNPRWKGDSLEFSVLNKTLQLDAPSGTDTSYLSVESSASFNASWALSIDLQFNPSSSNYAKVYLTSDKSDLNGSLNGYFVKIGGTKDEICLYRQDDKKEILLIDGRDALLNKTINSIQLTVTRSKKYEWELLTETSDSALSSEGIASDSTYKSSKFFGISCRYTSTRSDKMSFDDVIVVGQKFIDIYPPYLLEQGLISGNNWRLIFSEKLDQGSLSTAAFTTEPTREQVGSLSYDSMTSTLELSFNSKVEHGKRISLKIDSVSDLAGNYFIGTAYSFFNYEDSLNFKDVVLTEIMPDPSPVIALPNSEYIELYNRSNRYISLNNWMLSDTKDTISLPNIALDPNSYLILHDSGDTLLWKSFNSPRASIKMPSLNNDGEVVRIHSSSTTLIDSMTYDIHQYPDDKKDGGWSLELINPNLMCSSQQNWKASINKAGGSPGYINSMHDEEFELDAFSIKHILNVTDSMIELDYSGYIKTDDLDQLPCLPERTIKVTRDNKEQLLLLPDEKFEKNTLYEIDFVGISDCSGGFQEEFTLPVIIPVKAEKNQILLNEVLFNPYSGGSDFVELYNPTSNYFDLKDMKLASFENDTIDNMKTLSMKYELLGPGVYMAFTEDSSHLMTTYINSQAKAIRSADLPSYSDKSGRVYLLSDLDSIIDGMSFHETMHVPYIDNYEGVSLERISPKINGFNTSNWTSASSSSGFATPGMENSQYRSDNVENLHLDPPIFSPDNDGYNDWLKINYSFSTSGNLGSIKIYNKGGMLIRKLVSEEILGKTGTYIWKGLDDDGKRVAIGYYVIVFESISRNGEVDHNISTVVVATELN